MEETRSKPLILTKNLRHRKKQKSLKLVAALKNAGDKTEAMELDSGDEELADFLNARYFMMNNATGPKVTKFTNDTASCAAPNNKSAFSRAPSMSTFTKAVSHPFRTDILSDDFDSEVEISEHSSC